MAGASLKTLLVRKVSLLLPLLSAVNLLTQKHVVIVMFLPIPQCLKITKIVSFYNFTTGRPRLPIHSYRNLSKIIESHQKILRVIKSFKKFSLFEFSCLNLQLRITPQLL